MQRLFTLTTSSEQVLARFTRAARCTLSRRIHGQGASSAACTDGDWYVSAEANGFPTRIDLCANACDMTLADPNSWVEIKATCVEVG